MDSSDWSNGIRYHTFDTRFDTEFKKKMYMTLLCGGKSCHQCQTRTSNIFCQHKNPQGFSCNSTFCTGCYNNHYQYMTPQQFATKCPRQGLH